MLSDEDLSILPHSEDVKIRILTHNHGSAETPCHQPWWYMAVHQSVAVRPVALCEVRT